jgi:hypothetical protein
VINYKDYRVSKDERFWPLIIAGLPLRGTSASLRYEEGPQLAKRVDHRDRIGQR